MDKFPDGVFTLNESLQIEFCNDALARLTGHSPASLVGAPMTVLVPESAFVDLGRRGAASSPGRTAAEDRVPLRRYVTDLATSKVEVGKRDAIHCIAPISHKSGVEIEVGWFVLAVDLGGAIRIVVSIHGLEESIRFASTDSAPADADRVHQIIFENAPIGIFHFDERGVVTACNDVFVSIIGSSRRHLIGLDTQTLPNPQMVSAIAAALAGQRTSVRDDYVSSTADKTTPVTVDLAPVLGADGKVAGGVGLVQDVTEHRTKERLLARAERLASLGTLAAGMVHEIQNPLAFAVTSLDIAARLIDGTLDVARLTELRATIRSAREGALRVSSIARDLKTFARADDERRASVDLEAAIDSALQLVRPQLKARARLDRRYKGVPHLWANEHRLVQLFVNLLVNCIDAIAEGDVEANEIVVSTRVAEDGSVRVEIDDTGKGIAPEEAGHVFEPFWTNKPNGMGLGLAICHGIVTGLGGEIFHEPGGAEDAPRGTRTVVVFPSSTIAANREARSRDLEGEGASKPGLSSATRPRTASSSAPPASGASRIAASAGRRGNILVIDDEERLATTIRIALSPLHDVEIATSGREALKRLESNDYDVILCDLFLPDIGGPDIYDEVVRTKPAIAERFVFLTGGAFTDRARTFLQDVPNPRLEKPFELSDLEDLIAKRIRAQNR